MNASHNPAPWRARTEMDHGSSQSHPPFCRLVALPLPVPCPSRSLDGRKPTPPRSSERLRGAHTSRPHSVSRHCRARHTRALGHGASHMRLATLSLTPCPTPRFTPRTESRRLRAPSARGAPLILILASRQGYACVRAVDSPVVVACPVSERTASRRSPTSCRRQSA